MKGVRVCGFGTSGPFGYNSSMSNQKKKEGTGRLVPTMSTGLAYPVRFCIKFVEEALTPSKGSKAAQWLRCSVRSLSGLIPNGNYFLYPDEGGVHQVKYANGKWLFLSAAN